MADETTDATTRWQGFTHKELYKLLHEGSGPAASAEPSRRWSEIATTLTEVGDDLQVALDRTGAGWTGRAAGQAHERLSVLVAWAQQTGAHATGMREAVEVQAEHLAKARAEMPVPEEEPPVAPDPAAAAPAQVLAAQNDLEPVETAATAGQQRAFEVMTAYQTSTDATTTGMASFDAPGQVLDAGEVHRHGGPGVALTTPSVALSTVGATVVPTDPQGRPHGHGHGRGAHWDSGVTIGAAADDSARPAPRRPGPGTYTGAATPGSPMLLPGNPFLEGGRRYSGRTGTGTGPGFGTTTGVGPGGGSASGGSGSGTGFGTGLGPGAGPGGAPGSGSPTAGGPHGPQGPRSTVPTTGSSIGAGFTGLHGGIDSPDIQSAAASQMAAAAGTPAAATPGAAAGTGLGAGQDKGMMRRGFDVIGAGQWFDDPGDEVRGAAPTRRNHDRPTDRVTESISIDGEEHNLPPTVIGD